MQSTPYGAQTGKFSLPVIVMVGGKFRNKVQKPSNFSIVPPVFKAWKQIALAFLPRM